VVEVKSKADFGMESLRDRGKPDGIDIRLSPQWVAANPFAGLR
jgi:hypothetical protein